MPKVKFATTGEEVEVAEGTQIKDIAKDNGWPIPFGCEDGVCGTCICRVAEGAENLSAVQEKEQLTLEAMGLDGGEYILCCQRSINGDVTLEQ